MGRTIRMKKSPNHTEPYALFYIFSTNQPFVAVRGWRTAAVAYESTPTSLHIITYPCRMGQTLRINSPYLTYAFAIFTYRPYTVARMNYTIFMAIRTPRTSNRSIRTRAVSVEWRYVRYESITYHANYITYPPVPFVQNVLLANLSNPKNCHLGIKVAKSAILHRIF